MNKITIGLCQLQNGTDKKKNIDKAERMICEAKSKGAELIILPEIFNCLYHYSYFRDNGENYPNGETIKMMRRVSKNEGIYLVGGSIPEIDEVGNLYNTSFIFDNQGELIGRHRKIHLFDINIKDKITFFESRVFNKGNDITVVDTKWGKIGVAICYDIRFPELMRLMALKGAEIIVIPAAFNMTTGPAHWETLFKCRAVDNQVYMIGASPARDEKGSYVAYGNSIVVDPWGNIIKKMDEKEGVSICEIDLNYIKKVREELPLLSHRRTDLYSLE